jgi:hypothetical protein
MSREWERRYRRALLGVVAWSCWASAVLAAEDGSARVSVQLLDASRGLLRSERPFRARDLGGSAFGHNDGRPVEPLRAHVDLSPALDEIFGFFHRHGVPLQQQLDEDGDGPVGVYADFSLGRDVPAVSFNLGDRSIEPLGAFYSSGHGFRCAVVWPINRFTLRLEGGDDSEFGYYGIAGVQWLDPHRPLALGIGVPMNLRGAEGAVGVVFQLRMNLD